MPQPQPADARAEIADTLRDLVSAFGAETVLAVAAESDILGAAPLTHERESRLVRAYTVLLLEAKHTRAIALIVGRLCNLDTATGREIRQEDIAQQIGVTKQAVCNLEADIADKLGLPRRSSPHARASHRLMNRRNYARPTAAP